MVEKMMKPMFRAININENARRIDVDDKIPLSNYYRIASNLIKQAAIYREEKNLIDLYIILLRFSSLLSETIPFHVDYKVLFPEKRTAFKKKLWNVITELESLKPEVHRLVDELNQELMLQFDLQARSTETSDEPTVREIVSIHSGIDKLYQTPRFGTPQSSRKNGELSQSDISNVHVGRQFDKLMSIKLPPPKEETLSRHSVLGHNRFQAQCLPLSGMKIHYPSNSVLTLAEISRSNHDEKSRIERSKIESVLSLDDGRWIVPVNENYISSIEPIQSDYLPNNLRQPSPPPVLAQVHNALPLSPSKVADPQPGPAKTLPEGIPDSKTYHHIHVSVRMMEDFMRLAQANTSNNLETCGILAGLLKNRMFCVTTLIIPKQESTSDSCQTLNEEEIFDVQDKLSLFPLGWIHTHPSQSCFMSSVDLHTHYSYQVMLPEAIAIVMAPKDDIRTHGIFHLSDPGGISLIRNCQQRGFHPHEEPPDGSPIYEHCSHVYMNPNLKCDVMDLRN